DETDEVIAISEARELSRTAPEAECADKDFKEIESTEGEALLPGVVDKRTPGNHGSKGYTNVGRPAPARRDQQIRKQQPIGDPDEIGLGSESDADGAHHDEH